MEAIYHAGRVVLLLPMTNPNRTDVTLWRNVKGIVFNGDIYIDDRFFNIMRF